MTVTVTPTITVTTTTVGTDVVVTIVGTGTYDWVAPTGCIKTRSLLVAPGGAGSAGCGGGGAGGEVLDIDNIPLTPGETYTISLGNPGTCETCSKGTSGGNTTFAATPSIAHGGGAGGLGYAGTEAEGDGEDGGNGGGAAFYYDEGLELNVAASPGTGVQHDGGQCVGNGDSSIFWPGGGAGAGEDGGDGNSTTALPGKGGDGLTSDITGTSTKYGGGGAGLGSDNSTNVGGDGGGGDSSSTTHGEDGTDDLGGGGGATTLCSRGFYVHGGKGGTGCVILRYTASTASTTDVTKSLTYEIVKSLTVGLQYTVTKVHNITHDIKYSIQSLVPIQSLLSYEIVIPTHVDLQYSNQYRIYTTHLLPVVLGYKVAISHTCGSPIQPTDYIKNGSFTDGLTNWTDPAGTGAATGYISGRYCLIGTISGAYNPRVVQNIVISRDCTRITANIYASTSNSYFVITIRSLDTGSVLYSLGVSPASLGSWLAQSFTVALGPGNYQIVTGFNSGAIGCGITDIVLDCNGISLAYNILPGTSILVPARYLITRNRDISLASQYVIFHPKVSTSSEYRIQHPTDKLISLTYVVPQCTIAATPTTGFSPMHTIVTATASLKPVSYKWYVDGILRATTTINQATLQIIGNCAHTISVVVVGSVGWQATDHTTINLTPVTAVIPVFYANVVSGLYPLTVRFNNMTYDPDGTLSWDWDFGDGSAHSSEKNPVHVYQTSANYSVTLRVISP